MKRRPPSSTLTDTLLPYTTLVRSLRADLPEVPLAAVPIVEDRCRSFAIGEGCMFLNQSFEHPFPIGAAQTLPDDAFRICVSFEAAIDIQHESHAAGHASTEVSSGAAKDDRRPAGHIFAAIRAAAFDHHLRARIADGEAFARLTGGEKLARRCPVQNGVADNGVLLAFQRAAHHGLNRDDPARQTLADIIIGVAEDFEPDALAQKRAQRLARTTAQADMDMPVSQRGHAEIGRAHV